MKWEVTIFQSKSALEEANHGNPFVCLFVDPILANYNVYITWPFRKSSSSKPKKGGNKDDNNDNNKKIDVAVIPGLLSECPLCHRLISRWQGNPEKVQCIWCFKDITKHGPQFVCKNKECSKAYKNPICLYCWYKQTTPDTYK